MIIEAAICATMSSGKSTILNALIGNNFIPSSNIACTAKIISIENDITQNQIYGSRLMKDGQMFCEEIPNPETLINWNDDIDIVQIYLAANFQNLNCSFTIHDTPGTNYSRELTHKKITQNFLRQYPLDLIIFVINAEHSGTIDEKDLLLWIKTEVIDKRGVDIIFLVNKMDSIDFDCEDLYENLDGTKNHLTNLGYTNPLIIPISSKAALLFRMVLNHQQLTKRELIDFEALYLYFMRENFELIKYTNFFIDIDMNIDINGTICVDDKNYKRRDLYYVLQKTGINVLEEVIKQKAGGMMNEESLS